MITGATGGEDSSSSQDEPRFLFEDDKSSSESDSDPEKTKDEIVLQEASGQSNQDSEKNGLTPEEKVEVIKKVIGEDPSELKLLFDRANKKKLLLQHLHNRAERRKSVSVIEVSVESSEEVSVESSNEGGKTE